MAVSRQVGKKAWQQAGMVTRHGDCSRKPESSKGKDEAERPNYK